MSLTSSVMSAMEAGWLPDVFIRSGIRKLVRDRLREERRGGIEARQAALDQFIAEMKASPIALSAEAANQQHYEVPAEFFRLVLGRHLKYSCGYWPAGVTSLDESEDAMLSLTCRNAGIRDGSHILELGCGWGSLSLYMAEQFPGSTILAVSNSAGQKRYIDGRASARGLRNLTVMTADMNTFDTTDQFDHVVCVEMFEHMRNWPLLLSHISSWMKPDAQLFVHVFSHHLFAYPFVNRDESDWMAQHFFTGGMMPAFELMSQFQQDLALTHRWQLDGTHYNRTAEAWLRNMDANRAAIEPIFRQSYGAEAVKFWNYWRIFFMAVAETWGYGGGQEWTVSHYRMAKR